MALFVLYESASGFALFDIKGLDEIGSAVDKVQASVTDMQRFGKVAKLTAFKPFASAADALEQINAISEANLTDELKNFITMNLPKEAASRVSHVTASAADADTLTHLLAQHYATAAAAAAGGPTAAAAVAADLPDALIVDPPRKGLDQQLMQLLTAPRQDTHNGNSSSGSSSSSSSSSVLGSVRRLVYLSCGFDALAADTQLLVAGGWRVDAAQGFLFFPGTDTIETLAVFVRD